MAILGLLDRRRREPRPRAAAPNPTPGGGRRASAYLAEAALPLYIPHQPIVVAAAYVVVRWHAPIPVKYAVIVAISFAVMLAVYDVAVRRVRVTRLLFGMRSRDAGGPDAGQRV